MSSVSFYYDNLSQKSTKSDLRLTRERTVEINGKLKILGYRNPICYGLFHSRERYL
jgi:hypothetical protein